MFLGSKITALYRLGLGNKFPVRPLLTGSCRLLSGSSNLTPFSKLPDVTLKPVEINEKKSVVFKTDQGQMELGLVKSYQAIKEMNTEEVLDLIEHSYENLDKTHVALCLKMLHTDFRKLAWENNTALNDFRKWVGDDYRFHILCAVAAKKGPHLDASVALDMLHFMFHFGQNSCSLAVQVYLQLMKHHINDLHLAQLMQLADILSKMNVSEQTKILLKGIETLIKVNWDHEDDDVRNHALRDLRYLRPWSLASMIIRFGGSLSDDFHHRTLQTLKFQLSRKPRMRSYPLAVHVLHALRLAKTHQFFLRKWAVDILVERASFLKWNHIESSLESLFALKIYVPQYLEALSLRDLDTNQRLHLIHAFRSQNFLSAQIIHECVDAADATSLSDQELVTLILCASDAYISTPQLLNEFSERFSQLKLDVEQAIDICMSFIVSKIPLKYDVAQYLLSYHTNLPKRLKDKVVLIYKHLSSPPSSLPDFFEDYEIDESVLAAKKDVSQHLQTAFPHTVIDCETHTPNGFSLDFHVTSDSNEAQLNFSLLVLPNHWCHRNSGTLKGPYRAVLESIQCEGKVILIKESKWRRLEDANKAAYLRNKSRNVDTMQDLDLALLT